MPLNYENILSTPNLGPEVMKIESFRTSHNLNFDELFFKFQANLVISSRNIPFFSIFFSFTLDRIGNIWQKKPLLNLALLGIEGTSVEMPPTFLHMVENMWRSCQEVVPEEPVRSLEEHREPTYGHAFLPFPSCL